MNGFTLLIDDDAGVVDGTRAGVDARLRLIETTGHQRPDRRILARQQQAQGMADRQGLTGQGTRHGGVDAGESLAAAAAREVAEETGLHVTREALVPVAAWESAFPLSPESYAAAGGALRVHTLMVAFAARVAGVAPPLRLQPAEVDVASAFWSACSSDCAFVRSR